MEDIFNEFVALAGACGVLGAIVAFVFAINYWLAVAIVAIITIVLMVIGYIAFR